MTHLVPGLERAHRENLQKEGEEASDQSWLQDALGISRQDREVTAAVSRKAQSWTLARHGG